MAVSIVLLIAAAACQAEPRTEYLMEVTKEVTRVVVVTATPEPIQTEVSEFASAEPQVTTVEPTLTPTATIEPTEVVPTTDPRPTAVSNRIIVAEQLFEHGRMFYLQPNGQIWVMIEEGDLNSGPWQIYQDSWDESLPESDPAFEPPSDNLYQPLRGFGKLWRENESVRDALGWAIDEEVGHVTQFQFFAGGTVDENGVFHAGPGVYTLNSHYGGTYIFDESTYTWGLAAVTGS